MNKIKLITAESILLMAAVASFAQEAQNDDGGLSSLGSFDEESSADSSPITFNGNAVLNTRSYLDEKDIEEIDDLFDMNVSSVPSFTFGTEYSSGPVSVDAKLRSEEHTSELQSPDH